jgi:hypothetical protein
LDLSIANYGQIIVKKQLAEKKERKKTEKKNTTAQIRD